MDELARHIIDIVQEAGEILLHYYKRKNLKIDHKRDASPVTEADLAVDAYITKALENSPFAAPVISEEGHHKDIDEMLSSERLWLVDPLDGTRSFINQSDEFAVCIGHLENLKPNFGVILLPVTGTVYYGSSELGAFKLNKHGNRTPIMSAPSRPSTIVANHNLKIPKNIEQSFNIMRMSAAGKFGLVAEGAAGLYIRKGSTCEWDTAAGQCIVEAAGGKVCDFSGQPLSYGKENFLNKSFVAIASDIEDWQIILSSFL
ncbi:MAG: 3'(2'),5'-bisphosphate nucleotidase CysQ [Bdellovibrionota bacterium]